MTAYLGLGGNIGDPRRAMATALQLIDGAPGTCIVAVSALYRTPPWGNTDQPDFLNAVAAVRTTLSPEALLDACLAAERELKRVRAERWGPRAIDIDVLLYGEACVTRPGLEVPHPRIRERAFVLVPLLEIAPDLTIGRERLAQRLETLDRAGIERISESGDWWRGEEPDRT